MSIKQVIVIRKDLKMRRGKEIAQGAHAAMMFLTKRLENDPHDSTVHCTAWFSKEEQEWLFGNFRKVCLQVGSEVELEEVYNKARLAGLQVNMVIDSGLTEFDGVPTKTCVALGPDLDEKLDAITGDLKLY